MARIDDGYGGYLQDGYGGYLDDGYSAATLPFNRHAVLRAFQNPGRFSGRAARGVAIGQPPTPPITALPRGHQARLRHYAAHHAIPAYDGRRLNRRAQYFAGGFGNPPRAGQIVVEALTIARPGLGMRASQFVAEVLVKPTAAVRASQLVAETICFASTSARAGQVVVEALIPFLETPLIPVYPELPGLTINVVKRPKWSTGKGVGSSGREVTVAYWSKPQWEWDLEYSALNDNAQYYQALAGGSDIKTLVGFTLQQMGTQSPFYFRDPDDWTQTGEELGVGDGATTSFLFSRTYGAGGFTGTEAVGTVDLGQSVVIYLNGVATSTGFTINTSTPCGNFVQFTTAPAAGVVVTADFSFYYFCRFKDDTYDFQKFLSNMWTAKVSLFSLKN